MATEAPKHVPAKSEQSPKKTPTLTTPKPLDLNLDTPQDADDNSTDTTKDAAAAVDDSKFAKVVVSPTAAADDTIQRKMKRAERFGVPVQLSEEEKRNSRAERFGTATGSESLKSAEEQKWKARAERFGISVPADEEAKKKARSGIFVPDKKVDPAEEEKRKARALRFSQPSVTAASHINGNGDSDSKSAIAGHAGGGA